MKLESSVLRCAYVVDRSLRRCFPDDFDARCMYASFAIWHLTKRMGHETIIVAGDFTALSVAVDNSRASFQGYGRSDHEHSHYWCEVDSHLVDLGPSYLSVRSSFPTVQSPIVMWPISEALPPSLNYQPKIQYSPEVVPALQPKMMVKLENFLALCDEKFSSLRGQPKIKGWILTGPASIEVAASKGDLWALGTQRLQNSAL